MPDPNKLGNSGSFFKYPIISEEKFKNLQKKFPQIVGYKESSDKMKVAAGWLIDKAGWKGFKKNNVGVYENQALVLINLGGATGQEIINLSKEIQKSIFKKFKIEIFPEVNII